MTHDDEILLSADAKLVLADAIADYERSLRESDDDERERWTPAVEEIIRKFDL